MDENEKMKVSIIIPYNKCRGYLSEAVKSCENQNGFILEEDYEIIIQHGNNGVSKNINDAIAKANGEYIKLCGEDDIMHPDCLKILYDFAVTGGYDYVCSNAENFDDLGYKGLVKSHIPSRVHGMALENPIHGGSVLYRTEALKALPGGIFKEDMWTAEEYELTLRMADMGCRFGYIDALTFYYRLHTGQKSGAYWMKDPEDRMYRYEYIEQLQNKYIGNNKIVER